MFDTPGHHNHLALPKSTPAACEEDSSVRGAVSYRLVQLLHLVQIDITVVSEPHAHPAAHDEEKLVLLLMVVPYELALHPSKFCLEVVNVTTDMGRPRLVDFGKCLRQVDLLRHPGVASSLRQRDRRPSSTTKHSLRFGW